MTVFMLFGGVRFGPMEQRFGTDISPKERHQTVKHGGGSIMVRVYLTSD